VSIKCDKYAVDTLGDTSNQHVGSADFFPATEQMAANLGSFAGLWFVETDCVNYPALLAPSGLAAVGHSLRAGLYRHDIVPRDPVHGRGPASLYRPGLGRGLSGPPSTVAVDCPADLIPGVLALYPQLGNGSRTRSRSSFPSTGCETLAPQEPAYWWLLPSRTCAGVAVTQKPGGGDLILSIPTFGRMMTAIPLLPTRAFGAR
jgi:hypothetical protein